MDAWKMGYHCLLYSAHTFSSTVLFTQFSLCRTLVSVFIVLQDTNNHHHPYIDSTATTVLSDTLILNNKNTR